MTYGQSDSGVEATQLTPIGYASSEKLNDFSKSTSTVDQPGKTIRELETNVTETKAIIKKQNKSILVPCIAVLGSNFNFTVMAAAATLMRQDPEYKEALKKDGVPEALKFLCYAGAVVGQLLMGFVGDAFGRRLGMFITLLVAFVGSLFSAIGTWGPILTIMIFLSMWRFVMGVGSGGVYPLSAVSASEGTAEQSSDARNPRVCFVYSMNVPGIILPYALALLLWQITQNVSLAWRLLVGAGCIPNLIILFSALKMKDSREYDEVKYTHKLKAALTNRKYWSTLFGTGMTWFLYDVAVYGILLATPEITEEIFNNSHNVNQVLMQGLLFNAMGIPGVVLGILVVKEMHLKYLMLWGFIYLGGTAFIMAATTSFSSIPPIFNLVIFCVLNFFVNWGPSVATFVLPQAVYPPECRSTYNGLSAAFGKIGAVVGIVIITNTLKYSGVPAAMIVSAVASILGAFVTWFWIDPVPKTFRAARRHVIASLLATIPYLDMRARFGYPTNYDELY